MSTSFAYGVSWESSETVPRNLPRASVVSAPTPEEPRRRSQRTPPQPNRPVRSHRPRTEPTPTRNGARVGTSASHLHGLELAGEVGEVGGAQAGQRIPAAGGGETVLAAGGRALSA